MNPQYTDPIAANNASQQALCAALAEFNVKLLAAQQAKKIKPEERLDFFEKISSFITKLSDFRGTIESTEKDYPIFHSIPARNKHTDAQTIQIAFNVTYRGNINFIGWNQRVTALTNPTYQDVAILVKQLNHDEEKPIQLTVSKKLQHPADQNKLTFFTKTERKDWDNPHPTNPINLGRAISALWLFTAYRIPEFESFARRPLKTVVELKAFLNGTETYQYGAATKNLIRDGYVPKTGDDEITYHIAGTTTASNAFTWADNWNTFLTSYQTAAKKYGLTSNQKNANARRNANALTPMRPQ